MWGQSGCVGRRMGEVCVERESECGERRIGGVVGR